MFFGEKMFLLRAAKNLKSKCTTKRSPIARLGVKTGEISFKSKNSFSVLRQINLWTCVFFSKNYIKMYKKRCPYLDLNPCPSNSEILALLTELRRLSYRM